METAKYAAYANRPGFRNHSPVKKVAGVLSITHKFRGQGKAKLNIIEPR